MATSTDRNPTHTYTTAGVYNVTLTVFGVGGTDSYTRNGYITVSTPQYYVSLDGLTPPGSATVTGFGTYPDGASVTLTAIPTTLAATGFADIVFLVDESGSMGTEHAWLATLPSLLEAELNAANIGTSTPNQYALVGFGSTDPGHGTPPGNEAHKHVVGGGDWGTAAQLQTAAAGLVTIGGNEDGYEACDFALTSYTFRTGAAKLFVLITDEDRKDITGGALTKTAIVASLQTAGALIAVCANLDIKDTLAAQCIGRKGTRTFVGTLVAPYYTETVFASIAPGVGADNTNVVTDYCTGFAEDIPASQPNGGSEWDLNILRNGGADAVSFSAAFTEIVKNQITVALSYTFSYWVINGTPNYTNPVNFTISGNTSVSLVMTAPPTSVDYADIVFLVAQTDSMPAVAANLPALVTALEVELLANNVGAGLTPNRYALVGFEDGTTVPVDTPTKKTVGGADWGTAAQLNTAIGALTFPFTFASQNGDGYYACQFALSNYTFRSGAPKLFVLVTDEERNDITSGVVTYATSQTALTNASVNLAVVLSINITDSVPSPVYAFGRNALTSTVWIDNGSLPFYVPSSFVSWLPDSLDLKNSNVIASYCDWCGQLGGTEWGEAMAAYTGFINAFAEINAARIVADL